MLTVACAVLFTVILAWLHHKRPDVDPRTRGISHYAVGTTHDLMTAAFLALALALEAVAVTLTDDAGLTGGIVALWLAAIGITTVAIVPMPGPAAPRWRNAAHSLGAVTFFIAMAIGGLTVPRTKTVEIAATGQVLAGAVLLFFLGAGGVFPLSAAAGWLQRSCFALVVVWLILIETSR